VLERYEQQVISHSALLSELAGYARPNDKISELVRVGALTRLKKGLYTLSDNPQLYGLLPEAVSSVSSMCIDRAREYSNSLGRFTYRSVPTNYYKFGLTSQGSELSAFVIATPTKALCDLLVTTRLIRIQSIRAMQEYLFDDLRLDEADVGALNPQLVNDCRSAQYKSQMLSLLSKSIESAS